MRPKLDASGKSPFQRYIDGRAPASQFLQGFSRVVYLKTEVNIPNSLLGRGGFFDAVGKNLYKLAGSYENMYASQFFPRRVIHPKGFFQAQHIPIKGGGRLNILCSDGNMS
jgi:hypothetical protein